MRKVLGEGDFLSFSFTGVFFKLCNMDTHSHRVSMQDIFSSCFPFFKFLLCRNVFFLVLVLYSPPPPHFTFLVVPP